jgi:hypothetical protein
MVFKIESLGIREILIYSFQQTGEKIKGEKE